MPVPQMALCDKWHADQAETRHPIRSCWTNQSKQDRFSMRGGQANDEDEPVDTAGCCKMTRILDWIASSCDWSEHCDHSDQSDKRHSSEHGIVQLRTLSGRLNMAQLTSSTCWPSSRVQRTSRLWTPIPHDESSLIRQGPHGRGHQPKMGRWSCSICCSAEQTSSSIKSVGQGSLSASGSPIM